MDSKLSKIYYSPKGYWKGTAAIKKLAEAAKVSEDSAKMWLMRQALWQIYLPAPRYVPRPKFDVTTPNSVHQADLLFLPHDKLRQKVYKYALTVVDIASRYKEAEPLTSKDSSEVAKAFQSIFRRSPLTWPQMLQVDLVVSLWGVRRKKWTATRHTFTAAALRFTETRPLSSVSTARLPSVFSVTSTLWKCFCLRASVQLRGLKGFPMLSRR